MARLLSIGFEELNLAAIADVIGDETQGQTDFIIGYDQDNSAVTPRTGYAALRFTSTNYLRWILAGNPTDVYAGFGIYATNANTSNSVFHLYTTNYSKFLSFRIYGTTELRAYRNATQIGAATGLASMVNAWHYFEIYGKPNNGAGTGRFVVKLDGSIVIDYTGDSTDDNEYVTGVGIAGNAGTYTYFDDFVVNDSSGTANNTYPGQVRLLPVYGIGAGNSTQWSRAGVDFGANYAQVARQSAGLSVVQVNSADQKDLYDISVPDIPAGATIPNFIVSAMARRDSGSGSVAPLIRANTTESEGDTFALSSAWKFYQKAYALNPADNAAWEEADLATIEIGVQSE